MWARLKSARLDFRAAQVGMRFVRRRGGGDGLQSRGTPLALCSGGDGSSPYSIAVPCAVSRKCRLAARCTCSQRSWVARCRLAAENFAHSVRSLIPDLPP